MLVIVLQTTCIVLAISLCGLLAIVGMQGRWLDESREKAATWESRWHESACACDDSNMLNGKLEETIRELREKLATPNELWAEQGEQVGTFPSGEWHGDRPRLAESDKGSD